MKSFVQSTITLLILLTVNTTWAKPVRPKTDWTLDALRLTGESAGVRGKAIQKLLQIPHLKKMLHQELAGPRRYLALDVISTLGFEDFLPELLELAKTEASGVFYLSIDSLLTAQNQKMIAGVYRERLLCAKSCGVSPVAEVLLLDTLGQIGEPLSLVELKQIFDGGWYEVKSAVLNYARLFLLKDPPNKIYLPVINWCLDSPIIQLKWQTVFLLRELSTSTRAGFIKLLGTCSQFDDPRTPPDAQRLCLSLIGGTK